MSSVNRWILKDDSNGVDPSGYVGPADSATIMRRCESHLGRGAQGAMAANLKLAFNPVAAGAILTFAGNGTAGDTITIGNVVITVESSGAVGGSNQVNVGTDGTGAMLAGFVAALINGSTSTGFTGSSTSFAGICTASVLGAVVTLTAYIPGTIGNGLQLSKSLSTLTLTKSWGVSGGGNVVGSEGTAAVFAQGL